MMRPTFQAEGLAPSRAGTLDLVGGELALDFTNTSSGRGAPSHQDHLRTGRDVLVWAEHARVIEPAAAAAARRRIDADDAASRELLDAVLEARELIWEIATEVAERRAVDAGRRDRLAALHARCLASATLGSRDGAFVWRWDPDKSLVPAILGPITLSALTLLMERDLSRTKRCEGKECGWLFFDATKNKSRRWCEMRVCGNRAKVTASRQRRKDTGQR
ncbi:CGNR zinc finger domain-containing protein [Alsobacter sp. SYSU BS001988]|jgi:predicted RNA-binding Zn ribbon-like protein